MGATRRWLRNGGAEVATWDLARTLGEMGHDVTLVGTPGSKEPPGGRLFLCRPSYGLAWPQFEEEVWAWHRKEILAADVVHDASHTHRVAQNLYNLEGRANAVNLRNGGVWLHPSPPYNMVVISGAMRDRALRGASDYEGTPWDGTLSVAHMTPLKDARVVHYGVDTEFYSPGDDSRSDEFLWLARFHPSKGYHVAIDVARRTGIRLVLAGIHPDEAVAPDHAAYARDAIARAQGLPNVRFAWLPAEGHHEAKRALYRRAKALLMPVQFHEPFGLVAAEALACGTPVIATAMGSMPEIARPGETGFVCSEIPELDRAAANVDVLRNEDCRRDAVARFDRSVMTRKCLALYRDVLDGKTWGL